jgi:hypothetical protein
MIRRGQGAKPPAVLCKALLRAAPQSGPPAIRFAEQSVALLRKADCFAGGAKQPRQEKFKKKTIHAKLKFGICDFFFVFLSYLF